MDVDRDNENFEVAIKKYLKNKNMSIKEIKNNKECLYDFVDNLIKKGYKQKQIAEKLGVSNSTLCLIAKKKS